MVRIWLALAFLIGTLSVWSQRPSGIPFYVGTFTSEGAEGIYLCRFVQESGEITLDRVFKGVDNPNFLSRSPDGHYMYVVNRSPGAVDPAGGSVSAYRIGSRGTLEFINKQSSLGNDPCHVTVSPDGKWVAIANYGGGSVAIFPVGQDGGLLPSTSLIKHRGSGPHPTRQKAPYAHSVWFSKDGSLLYAADLGTDQLFIYRLDPATGMLSPAQQPFVKLPPGSGPRHFRFSADELFCYVANELNSTVSVLKKDNGNWTVVQTVSALPAGYRGTSFCADIHLSPDGRFVYVSNRGHQSIGVFRRNQDGTLTVETHVNVQGDWPRNFVIEPTGTYMLVANQRSHNIAVFQLRDGIPVYSGNEIRIPAPVCLQF
ncbi:MAG: lactonase family protein [Bacteroidota bacterium]